MAITDEVRQILQNYIDNGDVLSVRISLKNSLLLDSTFSKFDQMMDIAKTMPGLFDDVHEGEFEDRPWTNEYMDEQMVMLTDNFTQERIEHLKEVVRELRPAVKTPSSPPPKTAPNRGGTNPQRPNHAVKHTSAGSRRKTGIYVAATGGLVVVTGAAVSAPAVIATGAVIAAVGVGIAVTAPKK